MKTRPMRWSRHVFLWGSRPYSLIAPGGGVSYVWGSVVQPWCHESTAGLILWPAAPPAHLWGSEVELESSFGVCNQTWQQEGVNWSCVGSKLHVWETCCAAFWKWSDFRIWQFLLFGFAVASRPLWQHLSLWIQDCIQTGNHTDSYSGKVILFLT